MATQLFLWARSGSPAYVRCQFGQAYATFEDGNRNFDTGLWANPAGRDAGPFVTTSVDSVAGPTAGREFGRTSLAGPRVWVSPPLAAAVTISGSITFNIWGNETNMADNAAMNCRVIKIGPDGTVTQVHKTVRTTEMSTSAAVNNWSETPAAGVSFAIGDRIGLVPFIDDAGTMNSDVSLALYASSATAGTQGDSFVTFTETMTFASATPSGTTIYLTDTSAGINPGSSVEKEAWTSRGAGATTAVTNTATGPTAAIQCTDTAGGSTIEWYTRQLQAMTLSGLILVNVRGLASATNTFGQFICEIARVDADGTNPTVWGLNGSYSWPGTSELLQSQFCVSGDDLAISDGQRIRIRFFIDDAAGSTNLAFNAMVGSRTITLNYAGTSGGASGDTFLTFPNTLTEFVGAAAGSLLLPRRNRFRTLN